MRFAVFAIVVILLILVYAAISFYQNNQKQEELNAVRKKQLDESIEKRNNYVSSLGSSTRIVVNDGKSLFFIDNDNKYFGVDDTGRTYSFEGLLSINSEPTGISMLHKDSYSLCVGKCVGVPDSTNAISRSSVNAIRSELMPIVRQNLRVMLDEYGINPTHEYEHKDSIFGCDINTKQFYCVYGCPQVFNFSDLHRVTIEDLSHNSMSDANYVIHIYTWHDDIEFDEFSDFDLYFDYKNTTFDNILAMFKGIKNRQ